MKRAILAFALVALFLTACSGGNAPTAGGTTEQPVQTAEQTPQATATDAPEATPQATTEATAPATDSPAPEATAPAGDTAGLLAEYTHGGVVRVRYPETATLAEKESGATISMIVGDKVAAVMLTPITDVDEDAEAFQEDAENLALMEEIWLSAYENSKMVASGKTTIGQGIPALQFAFDADVEGTPYHFVAYAFVYEDKLYQIMTMCYEQTGPMADFVREVMGTLELPGADAR